MIKKETLLFLLFLIGCAFCCPDNCNDCDPSGNICFACKQDYELSVMGKCVSNVIDKCIVYGPTNQCFVCQPSFQLSGNRCVKQFTGCVNRNTVDTSCYECGFGKVLFNNVCDGYLNCAIPQAPCQQCAEGFEIANGRCVDKSAGCVSFRSQDGVCKQCKSGYNMIGYRCVEQKIFIPYCYIYYSSALCERCKNGYSLFMDYCLLPIQIQAILEGSITIQKTVAQMIAETKGSKTNPTQQKKNTTEVNNGGNSSNIVGPSNTVIPPPKVPQIVNCAKQNNDKCQQCNTGYVLSGGICQTFDLNCNSYELATGRCLTCIPNFELQNGLCIQKQVIPPIANCEVANPSDLRTCLICVYGFYPSGNQCLQVSRFCDGHNVENGQCFNCLYGLQLRNGNCVDPNCQVSTKDVCSSCAAEYRLNNNGVCEFTDPNCATFKGNACDNCKTGFYFNINGICLKMPSNCKFADIQVSGSCIQCNDGYSISDRSACQIVIANCVSVQNGFCQGCVSGYFLKNNGCTKISSLCATSNSFNGLCLSCVSGYTLMNGLCYDLNCLSQVDDKCTQCKSGFRSVASSSLCSFYDANCETSTLTACVSCRVGYVKGGSGLCEKIQVTPNTNTNGNNVIVNNTGTTPASDNKDPNCKQYSKGKCLSCSNRYYVGTDKCLSINPLCKDFNMQGQCTSCYPGYSLSSGACAVARQSDPYCRAKSANGQCVQCFAGYYLNNTKCTGLNPLCKTSNTVNGQCLSCYPGYSISAGSCAVFFRDPNCQQYNVANSCVMCSNRYYLEQAKGKCQTVNPLCKDYNQASGLCTACFDGYKLTNGKCNVGTVTNSDVNCKAVGASGSCSECFPGFFVKAGKCEQISLLCKSANPLSGVCLSCYPGYTLSNGQCKVSGALLQSDTNCKQFTDNNKKSCRVCYQGYFVKNGVCTQYNVFCKSSNRDTGACLSCYDGYSVYQGDCIIPQNNANTNNVEPNCITTKAGVCYECAAGFFLNYKSTCQQIDTLCRTYNQSTGDCTACYDGYQLSSGKCVIPVALSIPYCQVTSSGTCIECIEGYYVKNNQCKPVSILCAGSYNRQTGLCTSCVGGYFLQAGQCIYPAFGVDLGCQHYTNGYCDKCSSGFYLSNYMCAQINKFCIQFDYANTTCSRCFNKTPVGPECV